MLDRYDLLDGGLDTNGLESLIEAPNERCACEGGRLLGGQRCPNGEPVRWWSGDDMPRATKAARKPYGKRTA